MLGGFGSGRVERAPPTFRNRPAEEMRLREIDTVATAKAYASSFMASYNAHFAKPRKSDFNAHRPLRDVGNRDRLLKDTLANRKLIHRNL